MATIEDGSMSMEKNEGYLDIEVEFQLIIEPKFGAISRHITLNPNLLQTATFRTTCQKGEGQG